MSGVINLSSKTYSNYDCWIQHILKPNENVLLPFLTRSFYSLAHDYLMLSKRDHQAMIFLERLTSFKMLYGSRQSLLSSFDIFRFPRQELNN